MGCVAFVPARSGSKRVPNKNIRDLGGKPLFVWTLEACLGASSIDKVILSTDSEEYVDLAKAHVGSQALQLDWRDTATAGDKVKIFDYLKDNCDKIFGDDEGLFCMSLPTTPFCTASHIDEAMALQRASARPVFSATPYSFPISFAFYDRPDGWQAVFDDSPMVTGNTQSQGQLVAHHPNGAIYIRTIGDLRDGALVTLYEGAVPYHMDSLSSVDIDHETDFQMAQALISAGLRQ